MSCHQDITAIVEDFGKSGAGRGFGGRRKK